jgi:hypothetical protein
MVGIFGRQGRRLTEDTHSKAIRAFCEGRFGRHLRFSAELPIDVAERVVQVAAKAAAHDNDRGGNAGCDEAIVDGGRARISFMNRARNSRMFGPP